MNLPQLARKTIEQHFKGNKFEPDKETKSKYSKQQACFVTLTKDRELRGCVGNFEPDKELWKNVQEYSIHAAFLDPRFSPLSKNELKDIKIEVSVLSILKELKYENPHDLLSKINSDMGISLTYHNNSATFLPQVWEQLPDKVSFLEHLSLKAGLEKNAWKTAEIYFYTVDIEKES